MQNIWLTFITRLRQLKGTPRSIALGAACGIAVSFTPFVGFHALLACSAALLSGGSVFAAAVGTLIGNPWTFPFIWLAVYSVGQMIVNGSPHAVATADFYEAFKNAVHALISFDFSRFDSDIWPIFYPMLVGCLPFCVAAGIISYYTLKHTLLTFTPKKDKHQ